MSWTVEFYKSDKGSEPVKDFFNSLPVSARAKVVRIMDMLVDHSVLLKEPYTRQVRGKIRELRIKDNQGAIRVLYFTYTGKRFILLHGFIKKTEKTPVRDIEIAEQRMNEYIIRGRGQV